MNNHQIKEHGSQKLIANINLDNVDYVEFLKKVESGSLSTTEYVKYVFSGGNILEFKLQDITIAQ